MSTITPLTVRHLSHERYGTFMRWLPGDGGAEGEAGAEATCVITLDHPEAGRAPYFAKFYPELEGTSRALANEIVGYVFAHRFGLTQPSPACVARLPLKRLHLKALPPRHRWLQTMAKQRECYPAFCTHAVQAPTPWHHFGPKAQAAMVEDLKLWPECARVMAFDDIIANLDRNLRNLLRIGHAEYAIIDHGRLVSPDGNWRATQLNPAMRCTNRLLDYLYPGRQGHQVANHMIAAAEEYAVLLTGLHEIRHWLRHLIPVSELQAFDSFLQARTISAPQRIAERYALC